MASFDYIVSNFLTLSQLSVLTGESNAAIQSMIDAACLPGPAYRLAATAKVSSIFGDHNENVEAGYFPRSHVTKIQAVARMEGALVEKAAKLKTEFWQDYTACLVALKANEAGMANLFIERDKPGGPALEVLLEQEWAHYLKGTYGLCTRSATVQDIATKEVMIKKIQHLSAQMEACPSDALARELEQAIDLLDQVSSAFAPHEVSRSSRQAYITDMRCRFFGEVA